MIDVAVVNTTIQSSMVVVARLARCRVVWWCHESDESLRSPLMRLRLGLYRWLAHEQVAVSEAVPCASTYSRRIRNIVEPVEAFPHDGGDLLVLGTKCHRKGIDRLPGLLFGLSTDHDLSLNVVGWSDPREHEIISQAHAALDRQWGERLSWEDGLVDPDDAYRRARVLLLPSRQDPRPRVVEEALGRGIPVVASCLPGLREIATTVRSSGALVLLDEDGSWPDAVRAALAFGTSPTTFIDPFSPEEFLDAWILALLDVHHRGSGRAP